MIKCKYASCEEDAIAYFELVAHNGERWISPYCLKHVLVMQTQGYTIEINQILQKKVKDEIKNGEKKE